MYVLIVIAHFQTAWLYGGAITSFQEFSTYNACEDAMVFILDNQPSRQDVVVKCVPKSK